MHKREYGAAGIPTLLVLLAALTLFVFAAFSVQGARSDETLALRSVSVAEEIYGLYARGEEIRAEIYTALRACNLPGGTAAENAALFGKNLPECVHLDEDMLYFTVTGNEKTVTYSASAVFTPVPRLSGWHRTAGSREGGLWN